MNKLITESINAREQEVSGYQFNIDNYALALKKIEESGDLELEPFKKQLEGLIKTERYEQKKAKIMLEVMKDRIGER